MQVYQLQYQNNTWHEPTNTSAFSFDKCNLVLMFGSRDLVSSAAIFEHVRHKFPNAQIASCSTSGEILNESVNDDTVAVTGIVFDKTPIKCMQSNWKDQSDSFSAGKHLMEQLQADDLHSVFVLSDGTNVNGSELVKGFNAANTKNIPVTGGLAGDAANFAKTVVGLNQSASEGNIVAIGFYGNNIQISHSSLGGWDEFGKEREITKSEKNVLYEIDGENALSLYKEYLGPYAAELPGSALLFPLSLKMVGSDKNVVRTILSIDEDKKSMTFAGNLPEGSSVRLMKANFEKLINASSKAAADSVEQFHHSPDLAILISCVGRKLILQQRTEEEVAAAKQIFGDKTSITGFYSYGEISPFNPGTTCELHNQTMTITTFSEN